jgi:hypothetical protein
MDGGKHRPADHTPPSEALPDTYLDVPGDNDIRLLLGFQNEGGRTCRLTVSGAFRVDRADDGTGEALEAVLKPRAQMPDTRLADGTIALEPGQTGGMIVRLGPTVAEWIANGDRPYSATVSAAVGPVGARQEWALSLKADLLSGVQHNASQYRVLPHVLPELTVDERPRVYPPET